MKLAGFVVLGLVVTYIVYFLINFWILADSPWGPKGAEGTLWVAFLIVLPFSLLLGSILTGFLSYSTLNTRWGLLGIAPGLYLAGITIVLSLFSTIVVDMLILGLFFYLVSLAGVGLGYFLRALGKRHSRNSI
jgi:hypothetical protein